MSEKKLNWGQVIVLSALVVWVSSEFSSELLAQESIPVAARPDELPKAMHATIDAVVEKQVEQQNLVGVCVGIIWNGKVAYTKGYGFEDRENGIPASASSMFRWASISKPVTAIAALQLVEQGKLNLNDDIRKYVPEFPDHGHVIRVRDLMCHQSGIVHYSNGKVVRSFGGYESDNPFESVILALDKFKDSPLVHPPREKYSYSTHAYILLSAVVERAGKQKFADQVKGRICKPLNLTTLQPDYQWIAIANRAVGYRPPRAGQEPRVSTNTDVSWKLGGGGFISTIDDLAGFAAGLLGNQLINDQTKGIAWQPQKLADGTSTKLGLGFFVSLPGEVPTVGHNGSQEKTRTRMVVWPEKGFGVVVMSNSEYTDCGKITTALHNSIFK